MTSQFDIDPNLKYPFDSGIDDVYPAAVDTGYNGAEIRNLAVTLSGQWKIGTHTELRFDFLHSRSKRDEFSRSTTLDPFERFLMLPVAELGGQVRGTLVTHNNAAVIGPLLNASQSYSFSDDITTTTDTYSFQGTTVTGPLEFDYTLGYTKGATRIPLSATAQFFWRQDEQPRLPPSALSDDIYDQVTSDGRPISIFRPLGENVFPEILLTPSGFDMLRNPTEWTLSMSPGMIINSGSGGGNARYTAKGSAKYNLSNSILKYIEVGGFFESARFENAPLAGDQRYRVRSLTTPVTMANLGLDFTGTSLARIGISGGPDVVSREAIENLFTNITQVMANNPSLVRSDFAPTDPRNQKTFTRENNFSFYVMPRLELGKLEIVGGARFDRIDVKTRAILNPLLYDVNFVPDPAFATDNAVLADGSARQSAILPRLSATYRLTDDLLLRGSFALSVARPQIQFLNSSQSFSVFLTEAFGPNGDQPAIYVSKGNPDLKASHTKNYDLSLEKYFQDAGQIKLSLFYKTIDNLLGFALSDNSNSLEGVDIPNDPRLANLDNFFIQVTQPVNGDNPAKIYGLEFAVEKQFSFLPSALAGLGVYGNYTYTKGEREFQTVENGQNVRRRVPLTGAPKHSGTAALTYNKYGIDASLAYTMQGRRFDGSYLYGFDFYNEADSSLDFRAEYRFKSGFGQWRLWLEASDLLKGPHDADVVSSQGGSNGVPKIYTGGNYYGGRRGALGISVNF